MDDPRIAKLRELLDQATRLLNGANALVADLTEQLERTTAGKLPKDPASPERRRKSGTSSPSRPGASVPQPR